jgi:hypothetical protein
LFTQFAGELTAALTHTPVWVWVLLAFLIIVGLAATRSGETTLPKLAVLPSVFGGWAISNLVRATGLTLPVLGLWAAGLAVGTAVGYAMEDRTQVRVDRAARKLYLPGSWLPLMVTLIIFAFNYGLGYTAARWPETARDPAFVQTSMALGGLFLGLLIGRFARLVARYREG